LGLEGFYWIFLNGVGVSVVLIIVEVNEVGHAIVLAATLWAVPGEVSYLFTLKAGI